MKQPLGPHQDERPTWSARLWVLMRGECANSMSFWWWPGGQKLNMEPQRWDLWDDVPLGYGSFGNLVFHWIVAMHFDVYLAFFVVRLVNTIHPTKSVSSRTSPNHQVPSPVSTRHLLILCRMGPQVTVWLMFSHPNCRYMIMHEINQNQG